MGSVRTRIPPVLPARRIGRRVADGRVDAPVAWRAGCAGALRPGGMAWPRDAVRLHGGGDRRFFAHRGAQLDRHTDLDRSAAGDAGGTVAARPAAAVDAGRAGGTGGCGRCGLPATCLDQPGASAVAGPKPGEPGVSAVAGGDGAGEPAVTPAAARCGERPG